MHVSEILISLLHLYINVRLSGELKPNFSLETLIVKLNFKYLVCITRRGGAEMEKTLIFGKK